MLQARDNQPLYRQLFDILKKDIESGKYKKGERIPTEAELSRQYKVSRITVRNALEQLTRENLLERHRGRGTFVTEEKLKRSINEVVGFTEMCRAINCEPGAKTIKCVIEDATQNDIAELGLEQGAKVIAIERIRYVDGVPVLLESSRYTDRFVFLIDEDLTNTSMFKIIREKYGIEFGSFERKIDLVFSSYQISKYLNVPQGYPLLQLTSLTYDANGVPVCRNKQWIVGDKFTFTV